MIELIDVSFGYNKEKPIFEQFNLRMPTEEIHGVLGHNGAGKTTMFRLILKIIQPNSGSVLINNMKIQQSKDYMSYLPETNGVYDKLTVVKNLEFRGRAAKLNNNHIIQRTDELLLKLRLDKKRDELTGTLSNGMKKRLGLACAMISRPKLLLLDEPTNGIDPESLIVLISILRDVKETGTGLLISSHNLDFIEELADSVSIIEEGRLVYTSKLKQTDGSIKNIYFNELNKYREEVNHARNIYNNA